MDEHFVIIPSLIEFLPVFNSKGTYLSNLFNLNIKIGIHFFHVICQIAMFIFYILLRKAGNNTTLFDMVFIFFEAGFICSSMGFIFLEKGCLDYTYLKPLFVFDLKDLYLNCFICLLIIFLLKRKIRTSKDLYKLLSVK
jgi:hypothetical protein